MDPRIREDDEKVNQYLNDYSQIKSTWKANKDWGNQRRYVERVGKEQGELLIMETSELLEIIARDEDSTHQFKANVTNALSLAQEMIAFSNFKALYG